MSTFANNSNQSIPATNFGQKILFRFFFIYLVLQMADWYFSVIPYIHYVTQYYERLIDWAVHFSNEKFFHVRTTLVYPAGSGDTSWGWAQQWLYLLVAFLGCVIWSFTDRKRENYARLNYWLCLFVRYYVAMVAFTYGIIKLFALQMPFPSQSQLATPLGDFLPMRLCWMFMGYSKTYQIFTGFMETAVGLLLLYRKTATLGAFLAALVFTNVMMLNLAYDIPVKIFSMNMVVACLYLVFNEYERLTHFFVINKPASTSSLYQFVYPRMWMRVTRFILKIAFVFFVIAKPLYESWKNYQSIANRPESKPIASGVYDVVTFVVNKDTLVPSPIDTLRWQNAIFSKDGTGSIKTSDTSFRQRYKRGYFSYTTDTANHIINFRKLQTDSPLYAGIVLSMRYQLPDSNTIQLWGEQKNDSLYVLLKKSNRHFQLTEKQFHWLSEYNR
jgi:hypothetical protein